MSRIGSIGQLSSAQLGLLHALAQANQGLADSSLKLSTLKKINHASDNPSGVVQASNLQTQLDAVQAASSNVTRAKSIVSTADTAAGNIVSSLEEAHTLALDVASGTLSSGEIAAKQQELDDLLSSIDRSAQTDYNGTRLLDGTSGYRLSGVDTTKFKDVDVLSKNTSSSVTVNVTVTTQAAKGAKSYTSGTLGSATTLEVTGQLGTATIVLSSGSNTQDITDAFNDVSSLTGVTATRINGSTVNFATTGYGSAATIAITATAGTFNTTGTGTGTDTVATVNGASFTGNGLNLTATVNDVSLNLDLDSTANGALTAFTVSGSGMQFHLSTNVNDTARIGFQNLSTQSLGGPTGKLYTLRSGQSNSLTLNPTNAIQIINESLSEAQLAQAHIGAFEKYTLDSAQNILDSQDENLAASLSDLMDVDVPTESARLSQQQVLQEAALQALQVFTLQSASPISLLQNLVARL